MITGTVLICCYVTADGIMHSQNQDTVAHVHTVRKGLLCSCRWIGAPAYMYVCVRACTCMCVCVVSVKTVNCSFELSTFCTGFSGCNFLRCNIYCQVVQTQNFDTLSDLPNGNRILQQQWRYLKSELGKK